jgi:hypothetical protein
MSCPAAAAFQPRRREGICRGVARSDSQAVVREPIHCESRRHILSPLSLVSGYPHAQDRLQNGQSLHAQRGFGWKTPASIAWITSATSRKSWRFAAAGARVVQYRWSSGYLVFVSTSKRNRRSSWSARPFMDVA